MFNLENYKADPSSLKRDNAFLCSANSAIECSGKKEALLENSLGSSAILENSSGYDIDITTLTAIKADVIKQKFYEITPSDFIPVITGFGAYSEELMHYIAGSNAGDFEEGIISQGLHSAKLATVNNQIETLTIPTHVWAKEIGYSLYDMQQASISGNWNKIQALEEARLKNYQLGIQKIAFLGGVKTGAEGLINLTGVTDDTTEITEKMSTMTAAEFQVLPSNLYTAYREGCEYTAEPDTLALPADEFASLFKVDENFGGYKNRYEYMLEAFQGLTGNMNFKIVKIQYLNSAKNGLGGKDRYILYKNDKEVLEMDLPIAYTTTTFGTVNNFQFQNVGYAQFTGVYAKRAKEIRYFSNSNI